MICKNKIDEDWDLDEGQTRTLCVLAFNYKRAKIVPNWILCNSLLKMNQIQPAANIPENCFANINDILSWFCYEGNHNIVISQQIVAEIGFAQHLRKLCLSKFFSLKATGGKICFSLFCFHLYKRKR